MERVLDICRQAGLPALQLQEERAGFSMVFRFAPRPVARKAPRK